MKSIRIGSGAGYGGDRIEPALDLIKKGKLDYLIFECLAERTIALAQKEKLENKEKGYNPLLEYRMEKVIPLLKEHPVKIISNMGAANPVAAAKKIKEIAIQNDFPELKIMAIIGDDVSQKLTEYRDVKILETNEHFSEINDKVISANAYIGASGIVEALKQGADIIITGRVSDPSLVVGPLVHEYSKNFNDYDFLGKATVAGHLLECAGQVTGGYYADNNRKVVPELWNLGFPIAEFHEDGQLTIEKLPDSGGIVSIDTVKEQLLYEIQDPENYYTPDVIADFTQIVVKEIDKNKVLIKGMTGKEKTGSLKVSLGISDGFIGEGEISYGGFQAMERAELANQIIQKRLSYLNVAFDEIRTDYLGVSSMYGESISKTINENYLNAPEVRLRIAIRTSEKGNAEELCREMEALYTNGPYGGGGVRGRVTKIISILSIMIPEEEAKQEVVEI
ncbi:acyclic terpene utilization AtuA family protein [Enterococcus sp. AZ109]|uniref:acyclic terpene utilization AtuA family protein n=1 Tax=Enterococcus sp. AZ109 TaxID=2774634 RepID=UPI003F215478